MPIDPSEHPEFAVARAKFNADKAAATREGDEVAAARADTEWQTSLSRFTADMYEKQDAERSRQAEIVRIKAENPAAPAELFEGSDLAQMERAAKAVQAVAAQAQERTAGSWSPSPSGGGAHAASTDEHGDVTVEELAEREKRDPDTGHFPTVERMMDKIAPEVMARGALARKENAELQAMSVEPLISKFREGRRR
jgi:hypothetical protein